MENKEVTGISKRFLNGLKENSSIISSTRNLALHNDGRSEDSACTYHLDNAEKNAIVCETEPGTCGINDLILFIDENGNVKRQIINKRLYALA